MKEKTVYALGFFDGVHLGHQALLAACTALAKQEQARAGVLTFDVHPESLVLGKAPQLINTAHDRRLLLECLGADFVHTLSFDKAMMSMPWEAFFRFLTEELGAAGLVCGDDFRFGFQGQGTAARLQKACREAGLPCTVVPEASVDGIRVSSTHIRRLLEAGKMADANRFLGHPHVLTGTVVSGRKLGRTLGIPTANLEAPKELVSLRHGVYACKARVGESTYLAVTNVGSRPTVGGHRVTIEPWLLDFEGDLYGKALTLSFYEFLRPEKAFASLEELKAEILKNAAATRAYFA